VKWHSVLATNVGEAGRIIMPDTFSYHTCRQSAGHKMRLSSELAVKDAAKKRRKVRLDTEKHIRLTAKF